MRAVIAGGPLGDHAADLLELVGWDLGTRRGGHSAEVAFTADYRVHGVGRQRLPGAADGIGRGRQEQGNAVAGGVEAALVL